MLASDAAKADLKLSRLMRTPVPHPAGKALLRQIQAWRTKFFVFLTNRDVPATNNTFEREIRPSVVFRKVTGGFQSNWGAGIHTGYCSVTGPPACAVSPLSAPTVTSSTVASPSPDHGATHQPGEQLPGGSLSNAVARFASSCAEFPRPIFGTDVLQAFKSGASATSGECANQNQID